MMKRYKYLMQHACFECRKAFKQDVYYLPEDEPQPERLYVRPERMHEGAVEAVAAYRQRIADD